MTLPDFLLSSLLDNSGAVVANIPLYVGAWYLYSLARRVVAAVDLVESCPVCNSFGEKEKELI